MSGSWCQTDIGLDISAPMCLGVLQHTNINVHGCPATATLHWSMDLAPANWLMSSSILRVSQWWRKLPKWCGIVIEHIKNQDQCWNKAASCIGRMCSEHIGGYALSSSYTTTNIVMSSPSGDVSSSRYRDVTLLYFWLMENHLTVHHKSSYCPHACTVMIQSNIFVKLTHFFHFLVCYQTKTSLSPVAIVSNLVMTCA